MNRFTWSVLALWIVGGFTGWLSAYRPFTGSEGVAASLPKNLPGFELAQEHEMTPRFFSLLGTDDAIWRTYVDEAGTEVYIVLVFHRENWKSVHPPDICLRGSNMQIVEDSTLEDAGRLWLYSRDQGRRYLSLFRYGADGLATGSYTEFVGHHAPRAMFRAAISGYLIRVETYAGDGDEERARAERLCRSFLDAATPHLESTTR